MENDEYLRKIKRYIFVYGVFVFLLIAGMILLILFCKFETNVFLKCVFIGLAVCLVLLLAFTIWLYDQRLKQVLEYFYNREENEKKRIVEKEQSKQNYEYRLESLKWEKIQQIVKLIYEKKELNNKETDQKSDSNSISVAKSLIAVIKEIKEEIERI